MSLDGSDPLKGMSCRGACPNTCKDLVADLGSVSQAVYQGNLPQLIPVVGHTVKEVAPAGTVVITAEINAACSSVFGPSAEHKADLPRQSFLRVLGERDVALRKLREVVATEPPQFRLMTGACPSLWASSR